MYLWKDFKIPLLVREPGSGIRDTLEFCIRGQGVLFLPSVQAAPFISSGKLFELSIKDIEFKKDYFFSYHHKKYITKSMQCFSDYIFHDFMHLSL